MDTTFTDWLNSFWKIFKLGSLSLSDYIADHSLKIRCKTKNLGSHPDCHFRSIPRIGGLVVHNCLYLEYYENSSTLF
jgi:hypothetical protein